MSCLRLSHRAWLQLGMQLGMRLRSLRRYTALAMYKLIEFLDLRTINAKRVPHVTGARDCGHKDVA